MKRYRRSLAALLMLLLLSNLGAGFGARPALAAGYGDPLGLLPDWAALLDGDMNPVNPPDPLAGLLPQSPLAGLLPSLPSPPSPAAPAGGASSAAPEAQAPGQLSLPTPPPAPAKPGQVSLGTGELSLGETDLTLPGVGPALDLARRYSSSEATQKGPFGYGWDFALSQRLQMYVHYGITEHRGGGGQTSFASHDGTNGAFVGSYDGDPLIHRDLSQGDYTPSGAPGWSLVRESQDRYVVTRPDGSTYTYNGYHAPWR